MGSVAVGAMVVGTSMLVVFALAMATLQESVNDSLAELDSAATPIPDFKIENASNVEGAIVDFNIFDGGTGYSTGQVEVNGSAGTFLADLVITGGVVTGLNILDHGSSYLYSTSYFLEIVGTNTGIDLNITTRTGNVVHLNLTNDGSVDLDTDKAWLVTDGVNPLNLSDGYHGYLPDTIFPGETFHLYYYNGLQATSSRLSVSIGGFNEASTIV
jgi:archaellum component FlaF (FlaF/FlaG flagellin family)